MDKKIVTYFGSCRIHEPLEILENKGLISLNQPKYGYVHSSKEIIQEIKAIKEDIEIPANLFRFVVTRNKEDIDKIKVSRKHDLSNTNIFFVEISSLKLLRFKDYYLQINNLRRNLFADSNEFDRWFKAKEKSKGCFFEEEQKNIEADIANDCLVSFQDEAEIKKDIKEIYSALKGINSVADIIFVTHCSALGKDGQSLKRRDDLIEFVERSASELGYNIFNPSKIMEDLGQSDALEKNGAETNHFTAAFKEKISEELCGKFIKEIQEASL